MSLTISLTPGKQFAVGELITEAKLNALGNPTVLLEGSISSLAIADGSVTSAKLAPGALSADATGRAIMANNYFSADSTGRGKFANNFVTLALTSTTFVDEATLKTTPVAADELLIADSAASYVNKKVTVASLYNSGASAGLYTSTPASITIGTAISASHGLGSTPTYLRWVLVCQTADAGYSVGDEVDAASFSCNQSPLFSFGANATTVFIIGHNNSGVFNVGNKTTGVFTGTLANWKAKCYARL